MKLKIWLRLILLTIAASLWLVVGIGIQAQTSCTSVDNNLLTNCGFEDGFRDVAGANPRNVATGWQPWNAPRTNDMPTFQNTQPTYFASSNASAQGAIPRIREGGSDSQVYFSYFETHDAGVYQQVSGVTVGDELRFSIYGYVLSTSLDDLNISENPGGVALRVGIDPTGGTDALANTVEYSDLAIFYDSFRQYSVIATAESSTVTVFVRTTVSEPVQFTYVYLDDAVLEVTPESQPPANTAQPTVKPTNTLAPTNTSVPTSVPTATSEPTDEPEPTEDTSNPDDATPTQEDTVPTATVVGSAATPTVRVTTPPAPTEQVPISETFPGRIIHTVQSGDTVGALASRYGSSLDAIQQANGLNDSYLIFRGQGLIIPVRIVPLTETPAPTTVVVVVTATSGPVTGGSGGVVTSPGGSIYVVKSGDNLSSIARQFNTTVGTLVQLNGIANPNRINVGQQIALPGGTGGPDVVPTSPPAATVVPAQPTSSGIIPTQPSSGGGTSVPATYVVQPGDNLYRIAIRFNVSLVEMGALNNITNYNLIFIGQVLQLPL